MHPGLGWHRDARSKNE
jgi:hypothetical protein